MIGGNNLLQNTVNLGATSQPPVNAQPIDPGMAVLRKLRGKARKVVEGRTFRTTEDLIKFLRDTFTPASLTLSQCQAQLAQMPMGANESAFDYAFRIKRLVGKEKSALLSQNFPEE